MSHEQNNEGQEVNPVKNESTGEVAKPGSGAVSESSKSEDGQTKSISPEKLAANRANAQHSTGPKTLEGKARSAQNSRKHGFFARQPLPAGKMGDALWQAYGDLVAGIWEYYAPVGYMEGLLTEKIITESIRFSRLLEYESQYVGEVRAFHCQGVDRILRFQSAINRQLFGAIKELERIQDKRKNAPKPSKRTGGEPEDGSNGSVQPYTATPQAFPDVPFCGTSTTQSELEKSDASALPVTRKGKSPTCAQSQLPTADTVPNSNKRPKEWMAKRLTEMAGLPPYEPPKANNETNPNPSNSEQAEVSSPANQDCETKPLSNVGNPERQEHAIDANMNWLGVKFVENSEDEALIEVLKSYDGEDMLDVPPERLRNE